MRTLAVVGRKGGSGKTTVAVNLALAAERRGTRALIADTDPQRSALAALKGRSEPGPQCVATTGAKLFALQVAAVRDGFDLMIIDTPACGEEDLGHALVLSEMSLLVLRPTFLDLAAAVRTVDVANRLGRPAVAVVNQAPPARRGAESPVVRRALEALALMRLPVAPAVLRSRLGYQTGLATGRAAEELGDAEAGREVAALWGYIDQTPPSRVRATPVAFPFAAARVA
ncbi:MAG TPA: AAA family ATPase [Caulobacteraceae bacterium]|nr:AAA family ATPase [Caulobacteraceae bacterium]